MRSPCSIIFRSTIDGRLHRAAGRAQPSRPRALDDARRHRLGQRTLVHARLPQAFARARRYLREQGLGARGAELRHGAEPYPLPAQGSARLCRIHGSPGRARRARFGQYLARLSGRAAVAVRFRGRDPQAEDAGVDRGRRRGRFRPRHVAEDRACGETWRSPICSTRWSAISSAGSTPAAGRRAIRARCPTNPRRRTGTGERPNLFNAGRQVPAKRGSRRC